MSFPYPVAPFSDAQSGTQACTAAPATTSAAGRRRRSRGRGVDLGDPCVGVRAAHDHGVQEIGDAEVVHVAAPSREEAVERAERHVHVHADAEGFVRPADGWPS